MKLVGNYLSAEIVRVGEAIKPVIGQHKKVIGQMQVCMAPLGKQLRDMESLIGCAMPTIPAPKWTLGRTMSDWCQQLGITMTSLHEAWEKLPLRTKGALLTLAKHGWYIDMEMPLQASIEFEQAILQENLNDVEQALADYYEGNLDRIEADLMQWYPQRAHVIQSAFAAHRRGDYILSIPVLLAQSDGICVETIGHHYFMSKNKKPKTAEYVARLAVDSYQAALLSPLTEKSTINGDSKPKSPPSGVLNRHAIVHGHIVDYGTKINGLKAISLINYIGGVLMDEK